MVIKYLDNCKYIYYFVYFRDLVNESRYFAYHNTGLHIVVINFVRELQEYFMKQGMCRNPHY